MEKEIDDAIERSGFSFHKFKDDDIITWVVERNRVVATMNVTTKEVNMHPEFISLIDLANYEIEKITTVLDSSKMN